jgi:hypothetical protein
MKLFELGATSPSKQAAKVFESYFGDSINVGVISPKQARVMLAKIRKLVNEHKSTPAFHKSEQNPTYLKLMMMERVLHAKVKETATIPVGAAGGATVNQAQTAGQNTMAKPNATIQQGQAANAAKIATIKDPKLKQALTKAQGGSSLSPEEQQMVAGAALQTTNESFRRFAYKLLRESEVQQAQVVLAAQDMVDNVQKMSEQISSMQFKDLPALCDQIKNQVGVDQAMQFNTDATAALAGLLQNLQGAKQQLDQALGVVTGNAAPTVPGMDDGMAGELPPEGGDDLGGIDAGVDAGAEPDLSGLDDEELGAPVGLGRDKR